jgi:hypothetical protein
VWSSAWTREPLGFKDRRPENAVTGTGNSVQAADHQDLSGSTEPAVRPLDGKAVGLLIERETAVRPPSRTPISDDLHFTPQRPVKRAMKAVAVSNPTLAAATGIVSFWRQRMNNLI